MEILPHGPLEAIQLYDGTNPLDVDSGVPAACPSSAFAAFRPIVIQHGGEFLRHDFQRPRHRLGLLLSPSVSSVGSAASLGPARGRRENEESRTCSKNRQNGRPPSVCYRTSSFVLDLVSAHPEEVGVVNKEAPIY
jgi:hypothetical protein